jgi:hypothetical protein
MPPTEALGPNQVPPEIKKRLADLQQAVRDANHGSPSQGLLLSALIYVAPLDGEQLEREILGPYRRDHPEEDQPR